MSNTIKIICYGYRPGTAWTNRYIAYAKSLATLGRKVVFLFLTPDTRQSKMYINHPNIECIYLWKDDGPLFRRNIALSYLKNLFRIRKYINDGDVCFFSDASGFYLSEAKRSRRKIKVIFESTEHPEVLNRRFNKRIELALFFKKLRKVDEILVISKQLREFYISKGFNEQHISVVNMFVDSTRFSGVEKNTTSKYIAYCGSVGCKKDGVDVLIKSFAKFYECFPEYSLEIYGDGPASEVAYLKEVSVELGIGAKVKFCGKIPYEDIPQKLTNASILALSRPNNKQNQYGFPTKLGEYLATGNPVVVTSVGEIPAYISDAENGYLARPDDVESFAQKLMQAARDLEMGKNTGRLGKRLVEGSFSSLKQVESVLSIFA